MTASSVSRAVEPVDRQNVAFVGAQIGELRMQVGDHNRIGQAVATARLQRATASCTDVRSTM